MQPRPDVYIILIDALRHDMGQFVPRARAAPALERLARKGLDFRFAYTPYPRTFRAMSSMIVSRYLRYGIEDHPSILDRLDSAGWNIQLWFRYDRLRHTQLDPVLRTGTKQINPFFVGDTAHKPKWSASIIDDAIEELKGPADEHTPPRLRWLHLLDTHEPLLRGASGATAVVRYRAEVKHADSQVGRLLDALEQSERGRRAVVIVLGDHGESFGEHGHRHHGADLFDEGLHVPLIMRLPEVAPRVIRAPASILDIVPTLAHYLGLPNDLTWQGTDWLESGNVSVAPVFSQIQGHRNWGNAGLSAAHMVFDGRYKLIVEFEDNLVRLYDIQEDPRELRDLVGKRDTDVERLWQVWANWSDQAGCRQPTDNMDATWE